MAKHYPTVAGVDFGSSKVVVLLCEMTPDGLEVVGFGEAESSGVRKGVIVNIDSTVIALTQALEEAKRGSARQIDYLVAGVTGSHIQTMTSQGMVPIRDQEVKTTDVQRVIEAASAVNIPLDREVIQALPLEFIIDGQDGIHEPLSMYGKRLEVNLLLITGAITPLENIRRCLQKVGLKAHHFISSALASARSTTTPEEREAGVCVLDIGAASTDLAVFQDGAVRFIRTLPMGGMHLTNDLAVGLKTTLNEAQKLKHAYGAAVDLIEEEISIPGLSESGPRTISRRMLSQILQPRMDEILMMCKSELSKEGVDEALPSGIVITGGAGHLKGILSSAERVFRLPVRVGRPGGLGGMSDMVTSPSYATAVGLMELGYEISDELQFFANLFEKKGLRRVQSQLNRWFKDFF